jgi:hypothetical protein
VTETAKGLTRDGQLERPSTVVDVREASSLCSRAMARRSAPVQTRSASLGDASATRVEERRDARGQIRLWQPAPQVYCARVVGHLSIGLAHEIIDYADPMFERGNVAAFHDWFRMTSYDSASRNELTMWSLKRAPLARIHIGTRAKMVTMGVSVAAMALGESVLERFGDEASLEAAYDAVVRGEARRRRT